MADGVDHIDIYADVEEEFSQVVLLPPLQMHICAVLFNGLFLNGREELGFPLV